MLIDIELVGVCWCSVNMTVIFLKILNPTANLSQLVCMCGVNWPVEEQTLYLKKKKKMSC